MSANFIFSFEKVTFAVDVSKKSNFHLQENHPPHISPNIYNSGQQVLADQCLMPYKVTNITLGFETLKSYIRLFEAC